MGFGHFLSILDFPLRPMFLEFYCGGGDICIYAPPLQLPGGAHFWIRKPGKWTVDELGKVLSTFKL